VHPADKRAVTGSVLVHCASVLYDRDRGKGGTKYVPTFFVTVLGKTHRFLLVFLTSLHQASPTNAIIKI
jgi:hypothetical protein